jgi:predicted glycoside hydrolase/deacetylase ChbG (UPF0249 family)
MMAVIRYLIVNAGAFGQSSGANRGVIESHEHRPKAIEPVG